MLTSYYRYFLLIFSFLLFGSVHATIVNDLYVAKVPVSHQTAQTRNPAIEKAFQAVLIKVSGNSQVIDNSTLKQAFSKASDYVQQYNYTKNRNSDANVKPYVLVVNFAPSAINNLLLHAKLPVWGEDRPLILFWIAADINGKKSLIGVNDSSPIPALIEQYADARGMPVIFPVLDLTDLNQLSVSDVMAPFVTSITQASVRYGSNVVVIVRFTQTQQQWQSNWTLVSNNSSLNWAIKGQALTAMVKSGINSISDALATQFAVLGAAQQNKLNLKINGINTVAEFAKAEKYLSHLAIVTHVNLLQIAANQVTFQLDIVGTVAALQQAIKLDHILTPSGYAMNLAAIEVNSKANSSEVDHSNKTALTLAYRWTP